MSFTKIEIRVHSRKAKILDCLVDSLSFNGTPSEVVKDLVVSGEKCGEHFMAFDLVSLGIVATVFMCHHKNGSS